MPEVTSQQCTLFADDIAIVVTPRNNDISTHENEINTTIYTIMNWLDMNNLHVNLDKTNYVQFKTKGGIKLNMNIHYKNNILNELNSTKFVGFHLDENLSFEIHVENVCSRLNQFVYVIRRMRKIASQKIAILAYHGYVASLLRYGLILWGNSSYSNRAFIAQKKCIRALCGIGPRVSCKPYFAKLGILSLPCLYIVEIYKFVRQHFNLFTKACDVYPRHTRNSNRLVLLTNLD